MAAFRVSGINDGDTLMVNPEWQWNRESGSHVRPAGYDVPELHEAGGQVAKDKLSRLILGQNVELRTAYRVDRGRLVCDVSFNGRNLADYFPEYR